MAALSRKASRLPAALRCTTTNASATVARADTLSRSGMRCSRRKLRKSHKQFGERLNYENQTITPQENPPEALGLLAGRGDNWDGHHRHDRCHAVLRIHQWIFHDADGTRKSASHPDHARARRNNPPL